MFHIIIQRRASSNTGQPDQRVAPVATQSPTLPTKVCRTLQCTTTLGTCTVTYGLPALFSQQLALPIHNFALQLPSGNFKIRHAVCGLNNMKLTGNFEDNHVWTQDIDNSLTLQAPAGELPFCSSAKRGLKNCEVLPRLPNRGRRAVLVVHHAYIQAPLEGACSLQAMPKYICLTSAQLICLISCAITPARTR